MGKIQVTVCEARDLYNMQRIGVPDPFVRVICGDNKYKTNVQSQTLNPKWNETFDFAIADEQSTQVRFEVWNKNTFDDDLMGLYTLSLGGLTLQVVKDQWYTLEQSKTNAEIHLRVLAIDFGRECAPEDDWQRTTDITHDPVQRAIEDGRWRPGQQSAPVSSGPPVAVSSYPPVPTPPTTVSPYPSVQPQPVQPQPYYAYPQPSQPVYAPQPPPPQLPQPQPNYGYYPPQPYPPYPQYPPSVIPIPPPAPQPVYGYPGYPPAAAAPMPPQPQPAPQQPMYAPQPGYRY